MYFLGFDIPLIELIVGILFFLVILAILVIIWLREMKKLSGALVRLEEEEIKEIGMIRGKKPQKEVEKIQRKKILRIYKKIISSQVKSPESCRCKSKSREKRR
jgi:uncharacterized protein YneF (UPF0154 family)